ncbi:MAG: GvpL/GvpF family gas vesicle protein [Syntrophaceae bacterium]|nr:GvpL/GvpF family gas vesicle protein [Syntrophaceae bacterium]
MENRTKKIPGRTGRYIYALTTGTEDRSYGTIGINGANVYTISSGAVSAVVSDSPNGRIRPERRNFAAHQTVLKKLLESGDLLPMSFGNVSDGANAVRKFLSKHQDAIVDGLARVAGKVEMGLKVTLDVPNIFEFLVNRNEELRRARDQLIGRSREATQDEKIELGRLFANILETEREEQTEFVETILLKVSVEVRRNKCRDEREVMNLACLVDRNQMNKFEAAVFEAANHFDDNFAFDYNGPWAPHNFTDVDIDG